MATSGKTTNSEPTSSSSERRLAPAARHHNPEPPIRGVRSTEARQTSAGDSPPCQAQRQAEPRGVACRCSRKGGGRSDRTRAAEQGKARNRRRRDRRRHSGQTSTQPWPERAARYLSNAGDEPRRRRHPSDPRDHRQPHGNHRRRSWRSPRTRFFSCCMIVVITTRQIRLTSNSPTKSTPNSTATF